MRVESLELGVFKAPPYEPIPMEIEGLGLIGFFNPLSNDAYAQARDLLAYGKERWPGTGPVLIIPTEKTVDANAEVLTEMARLGPFYGADYGGDGTHSSMLLARRQSGIGGVTALAAAGNANDIAYTLNKRRYLRDPVGTLTHGYATRIWPLDITIEDPDGSTADLAAISYVGIGLTGVLARLFDSEGYRNMPKPRGRLKQRAIDTLIVDAHRSMAEPFIITDENGEQHQTYEHLILNGAKMATARVGSIKRLEKPRASRVEMRDNRRRDVVKGFAKLALGWLAIGDGTLKMDEEVAIKVNRGESGQPVLIQTDGEHRELADGAVVRFRISRDTVTVAGTRRKNLRAS